MAGKAAEQYSILIVSSSEQFNIKVKGLLSFKRFNVIEIAKSASQAKRLLLERSFDIVLINAPLSDELGVDFAMDVTGSCSSGILMAAPSEICGDVAEKMVDYGVLTVSKPLKTSELSRGIRLLAAMNNKVRQVDKKLAAMSDKLEELRVVSRAKLKLVEGGMNEDDAHRFILKQAMDKGLTRRAVAEDIIDGNIN